METHQVQTLFLLALAAASCRTTSGSRVLESSPASTGAPVVVPGQVAAPYLAKALVALAEQSNRPFYLNRGEGGSPDVPVVTTTTDAAHRVFSLDLSPWAAVLPGSDDGLTVEQLLSFSLPSGTQANFDDATFTTALLQMFDKSYGDLPGGQKSDHLAAISLDENASRRQECASHPGATRTAYTTASAIGSDFPFTLDCTQYQKQKTSGLVLTGSEMAALTDYSQNAYSIENSLLREENAALIKTDPRRDPDAKANAIDALDSLAILSAINKLDKQPAHVYRGGMRLYGACVPGAPQPTSALAESPADAAARDCAYFASIKTYSDCGFVSTSLSPDMALSFAGATYIDQYTDDGHIKFLGVAPSGSNVSWLFDIQSRNAVNIVNYSSFPWEEEMLFRPGLVFNLVPGSATVALFPSMDAKTVAATTYANFQHVSCAQALTDEQKARVSHVMVQLVEP